MTSKRVATRVWSRLAPTVSARTTLLPAVCHEPWIPSHLGGRGPPFVSCHHHLQPLRTGTVVHYSSAAKRRKHQWSITELEQRTRDLISLADSSETPRDSPKRIDDYFDAIEAWMEFAQTGHGIVAAKQAQSILEALEKNIDDDKQTILVPKTSFYNVVLHAYAQCSSQEAAQASHALLERMIDRCRNYARKNDASRQQRRHVPPEPSIKTFNIVINSWAKSDSKEAGGKAQSILQLIDDWRHECDVAREVDPNFPYHGCFMTERTVASVISAWKHHEEGPERALALLKEAEEGVKNQDIRFSHVKLDTIVYNSVIQSWARSGRGWQAASKAEDVLRMIMESPIPHVTPSSRSYAMVLDAWAQFEARDRRGDGAKRAEDILHNMIELYQKGENIGLSVVSFTTCIAAWARCSASVPEAPERAEELYGTLVSLYTETESKSLKPDSNAGNAMIAAWTGALKRSDSMQRAKKALEVTKGFSDPDLVTFNTLLDGYAKRGLGERALDLFEWLEEQSNQGHPELCPNTLTYNIVLCALARDSRPNVEEVAEELFRKMEKNGVPQNQVSLTYLIDAWSKSDRPDKAQHAHSLLMEMMQRDKDGEHSIHPDVVIFSVVLKACAQTDGTIDDKRKALDLAFDTFRLMEGFEPPNDMIFSTLMVAINRLATSASERTEMLDSIFKQCCESGWVSEQVMHSMTRGAGRLVPKAFNPRWSRRVAKRHKPMIVRIAPSHIAL